MREILFRGKRTDNGEWVDGFYVCDPQEKNEHQIYVTHTHPCGCCLIAYSVIPETVGQYTGLKDKNGKRIFEGDVVAGALSWLEKPKNGIVKFQNGSFGLLWYRGEAEQFNPFTSMCNIEYEVIGNIHDNPELLKGE